MAKNTRTLTLITVLVLLIIVGAFAYHRLGGEAAPQNDNPAKQNSGQVENGRKKAPDFTVVDVNGKNVSLSKLFGKPMVLNFWASWCPPCRGEMPEFNKVYGSVGSQVTFVMVDLTDGRRETKESGMRFIKEQDFSFPVYFDTKQDAATQYAVGAIPTTIFIDRDGNIVKELQGAIDEGTLLQQIELLK
ncbi:MAG: TlpA family protein disulfide reductase [Firmicutes bacterium]|nr:TlpA family protein disulfide reductase [Bacillota bacterium]